MIPFKNATISIKRKATTTGNKKKAQIIETGIPCFKEDTGTTADHQQTFLFMFDRSDATSDVDPVKDIINDGTYDYFVANKETKEYHIEVRAIKIL